MTRAAAAAASTAGYAPYGITADPARFGLDTTHVRTGLGEVTVRSSLRRTSTTAVILLHGAAGSWTTWTPLLAAAETGGRPLSDVIAIDLPGWGDSPFPTTDDVSVDAYARAVAEVARGLGYSDWSVVGHSLGGFIALHLASIEPWATKSAGLISPTTFSVIEAAAHPVAELARLPAFVGLSFVMALFSRAGGAASALLQVIRELGLLRTVMAPLFARVRLVPKNVVTALATEVRPASFRAATREAARYRPEQHWNRILCPVTSVRGSRDAFVRPSDDTRLGTLVRGLQAMVCDGAGHFAHIEAPDAVLHSVAGSLFPSGSSPAVAA